MAKRIEHTDDIDGTTPAKPIRFGFNGHSYEIDLSQNNADKLHEALIPYLEKATRVATKPARGRPAGSGNKKASPKNNELQELRQWAKENNVIVSKRGRIKEEIINQYRNR